MTLKELKNRFKSELKPYYPTEEVHSFFYLLIHEFLNLKAVDSVVQENKKVEENHIQKFEDAIKRLEIFEPVQYIIGSTEFFGMTFKVNVHTLIPRPETEELVQWILDDISEKNKKEELQILDIGTGSGCIAVALAKNLPKAQVSAIDISAKALETAKLNADFNKVSINFFQTDILKTLQFQQKYDIIVSNPPYVRISEKIQMEQNVLKYEPESALFVKDEDPLIFYRKIGRLAKMSLSKKGKLYFEINEFLADDLILLMKQLGFENEEIKKDIYGKDRMLKIARENL